MIPPASSPTVPRPPWVAVLPLLEDGFARADSVDTLGTAETGQTWTHISFTGGELGILDGAMYASTLDDGANIAYVTEEVVDGWQSVDFVLGPSTPTGMGVTPLIYRANFSTFNAYQLTSVDPDLLLIRIDGGVPAVLGSTPSPTLTPGEHARIRGEWTGDQHRIYIDDELVIEATDATYPTGMHGVGLNLTNVYLDRIIAGRGPWPGYQPYRRAT